MPMPYQKPDLDTALQSLRTTVASWKSNVDRTHSDERVGKGIAWEIGRMEERDDLASHLIETLTRLDEAMSSHHGTGSCAPAAWRVKPLTDAQFTEVLRDLPQLAIFGEQAVRELTDHFGIHYVRYLAQDAVKRVTQLPAPAGSVPLEADTLRAALRALGFSVYEDGDGGFTWLVVPLAKDTAEEDMHSGLHFRIASGERADRPAAEHEEPWTAHVYDGNGNYVDLLRAPAGLSLAEESALCARAVNDYATQH